MAFVPLASDSTTIVEATTDRLVREFVELPYRLYRNHPHWVPPLRRDEYNRLSPKHNPFLEHADIALWIAMSGGRVTGRIAAIEDRLHNETHAERMGFFGFFEACDQATARSLLAAAEQWARDRGCAALRGPVNPSLNESAGLLVQGFDEDPYILMPYNPAEYADYVLGCGYTKAKDLIAWDLDATRPLGPRIERLADRLRRRSDIVVRRVNMRSFDSEVKVLQQVYGAAWEKNWGFVRPTDAEIRQLAVDLKPIIDPDLVLFAEMDGRPVGCTVSIPDANQVLRRMNGGLFPFGILHFLRRKSIISRARVVMLGIVPEARKSGLYALLISELHRNGVRNGMTRAELSWTLEDNDDVNNGIEAAGGRRYKVYRLYEKPVG